MTRDRQQGASSGEDRAVVNGAALRASIPSAWLPFRFRIKAGRAISDPEKLVTPGILYASKRGPDLTLRLVAVGWWDWHVSLLLAWRQAQAIEAGTAEPGPGSVHESAVGETDASDAALLADICDNMAEVLKPLPGIPDAPGNAGTRATESGEGDEA
jgi:hypothetical protein